LLPRPPLFPYTTLFRSEALQHLLETRLRRAVQLHRLAGLRMGEGQSGGCQHQPAVAETFGKVVVVPGPAVVGVADDRMTDVLHRSEEHTSELQSRENLV